MLNHLEGDNRFEAVPTLLISFEDPLGAARQAFDLLGCTPMAFVAIEESKLGRKVLKESWPDVRIVPAKGVFNDSFVQTLRQDYPKVTQAVLSGRIDPHDSDLTTFARVAEELLAQHISLDCPSLLLD